MSIAIAILGLAILILLHEAGHFYVARAVVACLQLALVGETMFPLRNPFSMGRLTVFPVAPSLAHARRSRA